MSAEADVWHPHEALAKDYPDSQNWKFRDMAINLSGTTLLSLPWSTSRNNLTKLTTSTSVYDALKILSDKNYHAAPVFDVFGKFYGFCDMMQLTRYVVRVCNGVTFDVSKTDSWLTKKKELQNTTIEDLFRARKTFGRINGEFANPISERASLFQCLERMTREGGQHRLAIEDVNGNVVGIATQTMLIGWLRNNLSALGPARNQSIWSIRPFRACATIRDTAMALRGFELMDSRNFSMNGVAVVDEWGKLCDVLSTFDLKGILPGTANFGKLYGTVKQFKDSIRRQDWAVAKYPVTVRGFNTLEEIIKKMADENLHRVFVVDADGRPQDVISHFDILKFCLRQMSETQFWNF